MNETECLTGSRQHSHVFLGAGHDTSERKTWAVIWLCAAMMIAETIGGLLFGSIALVADGMHMSTHAGALLLAALAYTYARKHANDPRFTFGTGKFGDLAGFTSAIILLMIALLIGYEAAGRLLAPVPIQFAEAIPIAALGLAVNIASAWILSGGGHHHHDSHEHAGRDHDETHPIATHDGVVVLQIFEDGVPPRFRLTGEAKTALKAGSVVIETARPDGAHQLFTMVDQGDYLESVEEITEPHEFKADVRIGKDAYSVVFEEHEHAQGATLRDNNMQAAVFHVIADATVSVLVIVGLLLACAFEWLWIDPVVGLVGAGVIASWSYTLIRNTGAILLDMTPDRRMADNLRQIIEDGGDTLADLHLWRLGPGHLGAILLISTTKEGRGPNYYRARLARFRSLSHLTIEVRHHEAHSMS